MAKPSERTPESVDIDTKVEQMLAGAGFDVDIEDDESELEGAPDNGGDATALGDDSGTTEIDDPVSDASPHSAALPDESPSPATTANAIEDSEPEPSFLDPSSILDEADEPEPADHKGGLPDDPDAGAQTADEAETIEELDALLSQERESTGSDEFDGQPDDPSAESNGKAGPGASAQPDPVPEAAAEPEELGEAGVETPAGSFDEPDPEEIGGSELEEEPGTSVLDDAVDAAVDEDAASAPDQTTRTPSPQEPVAARQDRPGNTPTPEAGSALRAVMHAGGRGFGVALAAASRAMERQSESVRQTLGWAALITMFWAVCVWTIVVLMAGRPADVPDGPVPEAKLVTPDDPRQDAHGTHSRFGGGPPGR